MRDYNFFEAYKKKRNLSINIKSPIFLGVVVILLILATTAGLYIQNFILASRLSAAAEELKIVQASMEYQEAVKLQDSISALSEYDQLAGSAMQRIEEGSYLNTDFLKKLTEVLPSTASIKSVNLTRADAALYFNVPNQKIAAELVGNLDKSGLFLQTSLVSVTKDNETGSFIAAINCILKAGENE